MSRAFRLGLFIVVALLIFAAGVFWIGEKQFIFSSTYRLSAEFPNVAGLNGGAEVRVGGIHEGTVRQIQLPVRPNDKVHVVMELANGTRSVIKNDSVATIRSEGLVGDKFVEISFGSDQAPKVKNGDTIRGEPPLQLSDLLNKTSEVLDTTKGAIDNVNQTASNLNSITTKINQGQGSIGALINDKKIYQNVNAGTNALKEDMEALKHNFFLRGFFKERGYESAADLKKNEISHLPDKPAEKKFDYEAKKIFDKPDTAKLKNDRTLKDAGDFLQSNRFGVVVVAAYMDMKGDSQQDRLLTEARAMVVRDYLVKNFKLEDTRIKTIGLGKSGKAPEGGSCRGSSLSGRNHHRTNAELLTIQSVANIYPEKESASSRLQSITGYADHDSDRVSGRSLQDFSYRFRTKFQSIGTVEARNHSSEWKQSWKVL